MAKKAISESSQAQVVSTSAQIEQEQKLQANAPANEVYVASSLQLGMKFYIKDSNNKDKAIIFPGVSQQSRGNNNAGILLDRGASVLFTLPKEDWEAVKNQYSSHHVFTHNPPFLRELKRKEDYQSKELQSELKEQRTGAEPVIVNPTEEQKKTEKNVLATVFNA